MPPAPLPPTQSGIPLRTETMNTFVPVACPDEPSKIVSLTLVLSNARTTRNDRPRNRTETYTIGVLPPDGIDQFTPVYDPFSFCCYRAFLLGHPIAIINAVIRPGNKKLLTEPLAPQCLKGEEAVGWREFTNRVAMNFRLRTDRKGTNRRLFGARESHSKRPAPWLKYQREEVILDPATGAPPTFTDGEDFMRRSQTIGHEGGPITTAQAWSTWFWLLLHTTLYSKPILEQDDANRGKCLLKRWSRDEYGIQYRGLSLMKKGY